MEEGAIGRDDVIKDDLLSVFPELSKSVREAAEEAKGLYKVLKKLGDDVGAAKTTSSLNKSVEQLTTQEKELLKVQNQISVALAKTDKEYIAHKKGLDAINKATKDKIALDGKQAIEVNKLNSSMTVLSNALKRNKEAYAALANEEARASAQGQLLIRVINQQEKELRELQSTVTKTKSKFAGLATEILSSLGLLGGIFLLIDGIKKFININKELEKSLSDIAALTGATTEEVLFYREAAISLGADSKRSAKDVVEAFKLVGGARPELLAVKEQLIAVTKEVLVLANASGLELADAADAVTGALNQLQLPSEDAGRAINVMAAAAKEGAAEIPDLNASFKGFGAVLRGVNGSIEEGAALIEVLADRQIKGAEAGTALRNVLLNLGAVNALPKAAKAQLSKFGVDLKKVADNAVPLNERLRELGKISKDATALVKVFGKENFVAGNIILNNIDRFEQLTGAVTGTNEAYRQAGVATDNLQGDLDAAGSAVEALAAEAGGLTNGIQRGLVQAFTFLINVIRAIPVFIRENKQEFAALGIALVALNLETIATTASTIAYNAVQLVTVARLKAVRTATLAYFTTLAANPIGLILLGIAALVAGIALYDKNSRRAAEVNRLTESTNKGLNQELKRTEDAYNDLTISIDEYLKLNAGQQDSIKEQVEFQKRYSAVALNRLKIQRESLAVAAQELTLGQKIKIQILSTGQAGQQVALRTIEESKNVSRATKDIDDKIKQLEANIKKFDTFITESTEARNEESEKAAEKEKDNDYKLQKFRLEQAIEFQKKLRDNEAKFSDDRLAANEKAISLSIKLAKLERDHGLLADKATKSELLLVEEQYTAALLAVREQGAKDRDQLNKEIAANELKLGIQKLENEIRISELILQSGFANEEQRNQALQKSFADQQALLDIQYQENIEKAKGNKLVLLALEEKYLKDVEDLTKKSVLARIDIIEKEYAQKQIAAENEVKNAAIAGLLTKEQAEKKLATIRHNFTVQYLEDQIKEVEAALAVVATTEEKIALEEKLYNLRNNLTNAKFEGGEDSTDKEITKFEVLKDVATEYAIAIGDIYATINEAQLIALDKELAKFQEVQEQKLQTVKDNQEMETLLAGDNAEKKKQIALRAKLEEDKIKNDSLLKEKQIQAEKNKIQRRQAIYDKTLAATQATINTYQAATKAYATAGPIAGPVLAALIVGLGLLQVSAILAKPIPQYYTGTDSAKGGISIVGELGPELMRSPSGKYSLTPGKATAMDVEKGTKIWNAHDTMRMLALTGLSSNGGTQGNKEDIRLNRQILDKLGDIAENSSSADHSTSYYINGLIAYKAEKTNENFIKHVRAIRNGSWVK